jgi:hypothetical protein
MPNHFHLIIALPAEKQYGWEVSKAKS